jgi:signal transduction histidine kinase
VPLPAATANEVTSAVREALANVEKHAGVTAKAWVLIEDLGPDIVVSVRDDGVGIAPGRVTAAEREGRMGIARSLRGRIAELGGSVTLETAPGEGVEWELRIPR